MNLYLRKVVHPQAHDNYRVVLKRDEGEFEIGSNGIQHALKVRCAGQADIRATATFRHMT